MNADVAELVGDGEQPLDAAGDNLLVDLDIGVDALPAGSRLLTGGAILRVSEQPHTGCSTFRDKFGLDALKWVSTPEGQRAPPARRELQRPAAGTVRVGDAIRVERAAAPSVLADLADLEIGALAD